MENSKIIMHEMEGCGYCNKAKDMLQEQIQSGLVEVKPLSEAKPGLFSGAPAFISTVTGKTSMGLPEDFNSLLQKLGHVENYGPPPHLMGNHVIDPRRLADPSGVLRWYQAGVL